MIIIQNWKHTIANTEAVLIQDKDEESDPHLFYGKRRFYF